MASNLLHKTTLLIIGLAFCRCHDSVDKPNFVTGNSKSDSIKKKDIDIDIGIRNWVEKYLIEGNYFQLLEDDIGKPLTPEKIKKWYHLYFFETQNFDSVQASVYQFGVNSSNSYNLMLIHKKYKSREEFQVIGDTLSLSNNTKMFLFFNQYHKFSDTTQLVWYKYFTSSYYYSGLEKY